MSVVLVEQKDGIRSYRLQYKDQSVDIITYGARIHSIKVPDRNGDIKEIVCGYKDIDGYRADENLYFNGIVGRVANRISKGEFSLDGVQYKLFNNRTNCSLHGGKEGFDKKIWDAEIVGDCLKLTYFSRDMEEGYPGNLKVSVVYRLDEKGLHICYEATCDKKTICNLTNHAHFNLNGDFSELIYNLKVMIKANSITEVSPELIATGKLVDITGTDMDFNTPATFQRLKGEEPLIKRTGGIDFNYVLSAPSLETPVATVSSPLSGIAMNVYTDRPCMQVYTGNFLNDHVREYYAKHSAFCMETQGYPNACNIPSFPSIELAPGEVFKSETIYKFYID